MPQRTLRQRIKTVLGAAPISMSASQKGAAIDLQDCDSAVLIAMIGVITGAANITFKVQESDTTTDGDFTDAAAADVDKGSTWADPMLTGTIQRIGYIGAKRYARGVLTLNSGTSAIVAQWAEIGKQHIGPEAT